MPRSDPRRSRIWLAAGGATLFVISAFTRMEWLAAAWGVCLLVFWRGAGSALARMLRTVAPLAGVTVLVSWLWLYLFSEETPAAGPFVALGLRVSLLAFVAFSILARVDLPGALAPWPDASRLMVIVLSQIHGLRLLVVDSGAGLRSRLLRRPRLGEILRGAGGLTATLFVLGAKNARETTDALRSREL